MDTNYITPGGQILPRQVNFNQPQYQQPQPAQNQSNIIWVQGIEGAKAHLLAPGNTLALWDSEESCIYIRTCDANGFPQPIRILDYTERVQPQIPETTHEDYVTASQLNDILDAKFSELLANINKPYRKKGGRNEQQSVQSTQ